MAGESREIVALLGQIRDSVTRLGNAQKTLRQTAPATATGGFGSGAGAMSRGRGGTGGVGGLGRMAGPAALVGSALSAVGRAVQPLAEAGLNQASQGGSFSGGAINRGLQALDESSAGQLLTAFAGGGLGRDIRVGRRASGAASSRVSNITGTIAALGGTVDKGERQNIANVFLEQEKRRANEQVEVQNLFGSREMLGKAIGRDGAFTEGAAGSFLKDIDKFFDGLTGAVSQGVRDGLGGGGR